MKIRSLILALTASFIAPAVYAQSADVVTVVDESGSMAGEHAWLPGMISALDDGLVAEGYSPNQYGITGYGYGGASQDPFQYTVGDSEWFDDTTYGTVAGSLRLSGFIEDGYEAIQFALDNYSYRSGSATNLILVTDEDRDPTSADTYDSVLQSLLDSNALLNVVVSVQFECGDGSRALGIDSAGNGYVATAGGGYAVCAGGVAVANIFPGGSFGAGTGNGQIIDYVNLALASGGAAWDLNFLRANDVDLATSFTNAFVDIKVQEIEEQQVPEPGTLTLFGLGLLGLGAARRRRAA